MFRTRCVLSIGSICGLLVCAAGVGAQEPKPPVATEKPAGLRVMNGGHSWSTDNSAPLCQAAGIVGHKKITGINGNIIKDVTPLLEKGEIDVYVWQRSEVGPESPSFLPTLVELGPKHNPKFRVHIQLPWLVHDGRQGVKSPEEYEKTDLVEYQAKLEKSRKKAEEYVDAVNAKAGKRIIFLVPLADGMLEVRKMIVAGKFPGITKVNYRDKLGDRGSIMQGDIMPHQGHLGHRLGSYMHFAALYRMSPEGLKFPGKEGDGLTDEQRPILQKLAWDMVSKYPYAGIAKFEAPQQPKDGKKAAPKPGVAATAVPDGLKGWKETQDLPADTVVTDYNEYIEKLPKAERPGVSNVKYYVDNAGRNAVAVLVNLNNQQWTHLLVYDKQNKRTGVTKFEPARAQPAPKKAFEVEKIPGGLLIAAAPELAGKTKAWVWYAPDNLVAGEAERWMVEQFLAAGISAAGGGGSYGGPGAIKRMHAFYTEMTEKRGYSKKPIMLARSRGGLPCLGWAVEYPDKVSAFAGIYPVCNLLGWSDVGLGAYGLKKDSPPEKIKEFNPVDRLKGLAEAKAPLFAVHGDNDKAVPLELNSGMVKERYTALGGTMQLLVAPGAPHGTWKREGVQGDGFFRCQELVNFVKAHAKR